MNDTTPKIAEKMEEMFQQKTPGERLAMGCSMFDLAKELVKSSILQNDPDISPSLMRQELFLRFYGNDFNPAARQKIVHHLTHVKP
ncbi:MAG: hypothetical protein HYZ83_03305 [Candidatus Omnitrophica bacterium]|nr:hypothetical protein [Candidatus Omnitrophota bacterium]